MPPVDDDLYDEGQQGQDHPKGQVDEEQGEGLHGQLVLGVVVEGEDLKWDDLLQVERIVHVVGDEASSAHPSKGIIEMLGQRRVFREKQPIVEDENVLFYFPDAERQV